MILTKILAAIGFGALPAMRNEVVHEAQNLRAAAIAGHQRMVRLQSERDAAALRGDRDAVARTEHKQSEVLSALNDLARRLD